MNTFELHRNIIGDYKTYIHSFININDSRIHDQVKKKIESGLPLSELHTPFNSKFQKSNALSKALRDALQLNYIKHYS